MLRDFELSSSRVLLLIYLLIFLLAVIVMGLLPLFSWVYFSAFAALGLYFAYKIMRDALLLCSGSCVSFHLGDEREIKLVFRDDSTAQMKVHHSSLVLPYLIVLNTHGNDLAGGRSLIILPSMVGGQGKHRQLRIWLRWKWGQMS